MSNPIYEKHFSNCCICCPYDDSYFRFVPVCPVKTDFGSGTWDGAPIGIPYVALCGNQQKITVNFTDYRDERLKANFDINSYSSRNQIILKAMKKCGLMLADIGRNMYI